jgi:hypothetical protein
LRMQERSACGGPLPVSSRESVTGNFDEREQFERNKGALWDRLESIPEEIERETAAIRARYADSAPRRTLPE